MKKLLVIFIACTAIVAEDKTPAIPPEARAAFELAQRLEAESAALHNADLERLRAAYAAIVAFCGPNADVQRVSREQPLTCVPQAPVKK